MNNNLLNIKDLSVYLNVSVSLLRKLVKRNQIPYNRLGVKLMFQKSEIDKWLKESQFDCE